MGVYILYPSETTFSMHVSLVDRDSYTSCNDDATRTKIARQHEKIARQHESNEPCQAIFHLMTPRMNLGFINKKTNATRHRVFLLLIQGKRFCLWIEIAV
jgi:hypothetical protein